MLYALVHILNAPYHIDKAYTYHLPAQLEEKVSVGSVVVVPFGGANKQRCGIVTALCDKTGDFTRYCNRMQFVIKCP